MRPSGPSRRSGPRGHVFPGCSVLVGTWAAAGALWPRLASPLDQFELNAPTRAELPTTVHLPEFPGDPSVGWAAWNARGGLEVWECCLCAERGLRPAFGGHEGDDGKVPGESAVSAPLGQRGPRKVPTGSAVAPPGPGVVTPGRGGPGWAVSTREACRPFCPQRGRQWRRTPSYRKRQGCCFRVGNLRSGPTGWKQLGHSFSLPWTFFFYA